MARRKITSTLNLFQEHYQTQVLTGSGAITINGSSVALGGSTTISTIEDQQLQLQVL